MFHVSRRTLTTHMNLNWSEMNNAVIQLPERHPKIAPDYCMSWKSIQNVQITSYFQTCPRKTTNNETLQTHVVCVSGRSLNTRVLGQKNRESKHEKPGRYSTWSPCQALPCTWQAAPPVRPCKLQRGSSLVLRCCTEAAGGFPRGGLFSG